MSEETRIQLTARLRRERRWREATAYRDKIRRGAQLEGKTRSQALEESWKAMAIAFPKPTAAPTVPFQADGVPPQTGQPDLIGDILWVYVHLCDASITAADAPGLGAWALLNVARDDPGMFMKAMLPRAMGVKNRPDSQPAAEATDDNLDGLKDVLKSLSPQQSKQGK